MIYPVDGAVQRLNNRGQGFGAVDVQCRLQNAIVWESAGPDLQGQLAQLFLFVYFNEVLGELTFWGGSFHFNPVEFFWYKTIIYWSLGGWLARAAALHSPSFVRSRQWWHRLVKKGGLGGWLTRAAAPTSQSLRFVHKGQYCHRLVLNWCLGGLLARTAAPPPFLQTLYIKHDIL